MNPAARRYVLCMVEIDGGITLGGAPDMALSARRMRFARLARAVDRDDVRRINGCDVAEG